MKRSLLIAVLVASLASAGFATAAATRPLNVTLRGTVTESGVSRMLRDLLELRGDNDDSRTWLRELHRLVR
jgi:hypothetical protein